MTDRPILFSAPMVRALLDGRKTQTRRVLKPQPSPCDHSAFGPAAESDFKPSIDADGVHCGFCGNGVQIDDRRVSGVRAIPVRFAVGDRLYVREAWQTGSGPNGPQISFRATPDFFDIDAWDGPDEGIAPSFNYDRCPCAHFHHWLPDVLYNDGPWRTPLHMPRWASRLTLPVTAVRVQRLQDIDEADAMAEGIERAPDCWFARAEVTLAARTPVGAYAMLWDKLNLKRAPWVSNPWVIAVSFSVEHRNIDVVPA